MRTTIGIDIGGTRIKAVAIDQDGNVLHQQFEFTQDGGDGKWKDSVSRVVKTVQERINKKAEAIGIAAPGLPNERNSSIAFMPGRLAGLEDFEWTEFLRVNTWVLNDAISALLAESRFGIAKNKQHVVMLTLGTGVGGAILINGQPYQGAFNKAGHIGHMCINDGGDPDICGMPGSLEDAIGNVSVSKRSGGKFVSTHELLIALRKGDAFAKEVWHTSVRKLSIGLASLTNILSPEIIVLGGGICEAGNDLFDPLEEYLEQYEWRAGGGRVVICKATCGELAGAIGAACFAQEKLSAR